MGWGVSHTVFSGDALLSKTFWGGFLSAFKGVFLEANVTVAKSPFGDAFSRLSQKIVFLGVVFLWLQLGVIFYRYVIRGTDFPTVL